jgi:prepilin-type processing-associated H-X9-DG protein
LVTLGIIALLVTMLIPAIQSTRESSRRVFCASNEKRIAEALHAYNDVKKSLPPQAGWAIREGAGGFGTIFFHLLPYVEESGLYEKSAVGDFGEVSRVRTFGSGMGTYVEYAGTYDSRRAQGSIRVPVHKASVRLYRCPTEPAAEHVNPRFGWAGASYGANFQAFGNSPSVDVYARHATSSEVHLREWQGRKKLSHISDGLASTLAFAEKFGICNSAEPGTPEFGGCMWARSDTLDFWQPAFAADKRFVGPASMFQDNPAPWAYPGPCISALAQTAHAGGVMNCGFLDGSVRQVAAQSHVAVWWALCTPRDGDVTTVGD